MRSDCIMRRRVPQRGAPRGRSVPARLSSCVTSTSVVPYSRFISKSSEITLPPESASRLPVGSSASSTFGRTTNARASATRCCSPP
jgi:hypothetical protein